MYYLARGLGARRIHAPLRLFGFGGHSGLRILLLVGVVLLLILIARNRR